MLKWNKERNDSYFSLYSQKTEVRKNSPEEVALLAATVKPGDIIIYTSNQYPYAQQAK